MNGRKGFSKDMVSHITDYMQSSKELATLQVMCNRSQQLVILQIIYNPSGELVTLQIICSHQRS